MKAFPSGRSTKVAGAGNLFIANSVPASRWAQMHKMVCFFILTSDFLYYFFDIG
jgi:hypothetical protein